ncbi:MAG: YjgN family protein [Acidobacteria bacterium]|nr:YjgN family protein [Acidobacteriota bacterium]
MTNEPRHDAFNERSGRDSASGDDPDSMSLGDLLDQGGEIGGLVGEPSEDDTSGGSQARKLRFTADGREYFRIWIVNVALTLLTLGIYSAWAKVRARRYLYGSVWLGDAAFDYTANPVAILRGRILVATVLVLLWVAQLFSIVYYYAALLALMPLVPWVVVRARSFQMRNSRHRGIALDFRGKYWDAAVWYPLSWAASLATLGLARPFTVFGRDRFLVEESRFGAEPFSFAGKPRPYYGMYVVTAIVVGVLYVGGLVALFVAITASIMATGSDPGDASLDMRLFLLAMVAIAAAISLFILAYLRTRLLSYRWSNTRLGEDTFSLALSFSKMLWLYVSNAALIIGTSGLFIPFARIRVLRYVVGQFSVIQTDTERMFEAGETQSVAATGAEAAGEFGLEIGI